MEFYTCKIRLAGSLHNEVDKIDISAPEIVVLRHIHGPDAVVSVRKTETRQVRHDVERERLAGLYGPKAVAELFGQPHIPLPTVAPGLTPEDDFGEPGTAGGHDGALERPVLPKSGESGLKELTG